MVQKFFQCIFDEAQGSFFDTVRIRGFIICLLNLACFQMESSIKLTKKNVGSKIHLKIPVTLGSIEKETISFCTYTREHNTFRVFMRASPMHSAFYNCIFWANYQNYPI